MNDQCSAQILIREWYQLLRDTAVLLEASKNHHREFLHQAYALHDAHVVHGNTLAEKLELADEALAHAHDVHAEQEWSSGDRV